MNTASLVPVTFIHDYTTLSFPKSRLIRVAEAICKGEKIPKSHQVNVILCSDYRIRKLNREYRSIDRPTDVLSFPFDDRDFLGEIYISLQRAAIQARSFGHSHAAEIERLFVHGFIHLLGYDHHTEKTRKTMEIREQRYCCL